MITAGIDMGLEATKVVIFSDGNILGKSKCASGGAGRAAAAQNAFDEALGKAGLKASDINKVISTGKGKFNVPFADDRLTEPVTYAKAARYFCPNSTMVMAVGADETLVATIGKEGNIKEFTINQKCAAGLGTFLKYMSRRLGLTLEEMSTVESSEAVVNDGCVVFTELDALSLLNQGVAPKDVAAAITKAVAVRAASVFYDITIPDTSCVVLVGGLTKNAAFVKALKACLDIDFIIPVDAEYAGAIGAALSALS